LEEDLSVHELEVGVEQLLVLLADPADVPAIARANAEAPARRMEDSFILLLLLPGVYATSRAPLRPCVSSEFRQHGSPL
jgi:hypothetical protein